MMASVGLLLYTPASNDRGVLLPSAIADAGQVPRRRRSDFSHVGVRPAKGAVETGFASNLHTDCPDMNQAV